MNCQHDYVEITASKSVIILSSFHDVLPRLIMHSVL